jgi:hypothetical protein
MKREFHVRICEGVGVRFPRATRLRDGCTRRRLTVHQQIESPESFQRRGNHNSRSVWRAEVRHLNKTFGRQRRRQLFKLIA